jgi:hypothetical protein
MNSVHAKLPDIRSDHFHCAVACDYLVLLWGTSVAFWPSTCEDSFSLIQPTPARLTTTATSGHYDITFLRKVEAVVLALIAAESSLKAVFDEEQALLLRRIHTDYEAGALAAQLETSQSTSPER